MLAAFAGLVGWQARPSTAVPLRRLELPQVIADASMFTVAPDGARIAYIARGRLFVRELDLLEPRDLGIVPVTSERLFWSPDSRTVGMVAEGAIRIIPATGGPAFTVCQIPGSGRTMGAAWRSDWTIVFSVWRGNLYSVPASGGTPTVLLTVDPKTEIDFHTVTPLPDGRLIVSTHVRADDSDRVELADGSGRTVLTDDRTISGVRYAEPGRLVFLRRGANQGVWTVPLAASSIDLAKAELIEPTATEFDVSAEGTLVVRSRPAVTFSLAWLRRDGSSAAAAGPAIADLSTAISVSTDGTRVAFFAGPRGRTNLFVRDLASGVDARLTLNAPGPLRDPQGRWMETQYPGWFPSGDRVTYTNGAVEDMKLVTQRADAAVGHSELASAFFGRVSRDGRVLVWIADERGRGRIWYAPVNPEGRPGEAKSLFPPEETSDIRWLDLSPDGRLLAYTVRQPDSSRANVYLTQFPSGNVRWQVTTDGANRPRFSHDGRELFFLSGTRTASGDPVGQLVVVPLTLQPVVKLGVARVIAKAGADVLDFEGFDVAPDGRLLVCQRTAAPGEVARAVLVQNWPSAVVRR